MRLLAHGGLANWPFGDLMPESYDFIMVDYPWHQDMYSEKGEKKAPQGQYKTMTVEEGISLPVMDLAAPNTVMWMWAINPMLDKAFVLMKAWGFEFKTAGTWLKTTKHGKIHFGTGYILRGSNEPFLIGTRGKPKTTKSVRSGFTGLARGHSQKPEESFSMAEKLMPKAKRLELFSRTNRPGWDHWGDEVGKFNKEENQWPYQPQEVTSSLTPAGQWGGPTALLEAGTSGTEHGGSTSNLPELLTQSSLPF